jgi:hypothetical protein
VIHLTSANGFNECPGIKSSGSTRQPSIPSTPSTMPTPYYQIYQDNMALRMHGFPQFSADPEGNSSLVLNGGTGKVQIGHLGYFR